MNHGAMIHKDEFVMLAPGIEGDEVLQAQIDAHNQDIYARSLRYRRAFIYRIIDSLGDVADLAVLAVAFLFAAAIVFCMVH